MMKQRIALTLCLLVLLFLPGISRGQIVPGGQWESLGPEGGYLTTIAQNPLNGNLYAVTYDSPSRIFMSSNGGDSWTIRSEINENIYYLEIDPGTPETMYAVGSYLGYGANLGIYKSTNAGMTWSRRTFAGEANTGYQVREFHLDRKNPSKLSLTGYLYKYTGTEYAYFSYVALSADGGSTWSFRYLDKATTNQFYANCVATDPSDEKTRYVGGYEIVGGSYLGRLYKTVNDGATWSNITGSVISGYVYDIVVDAATPATVQVTTYSAVYRSTDKGGTWQRSSYVAWGYHMAVDPKNSFNMYVYGGGVNCSRSSDGGSTWTTAVAGLSGGDVNALIADALNSSKLFAVTRGGFFRSTNTGANWSASNKGMTCSYIPAIKCGPSNPSSLYISVMYSGLYKTGNALGKGSPAALHSVAWEKLPEYSYCEGVLKIAMSPSSPPTLYIQEGAG